MKRALLVALSVAVFTGLLSGLAFADPADTVPSRVGVVVDSAGQVEVRDLVGRCRRLLGEGGPAEISYHRCLQLGQRWCKAHPDVRRCPRPDPRPRPCKLTGSVVDRCLPCRVTDGRRPCPVPPPVPIPVPPPCKIIDRLTDVRCDPCLATDVARPCPLPPPVPIPLPLPVPIPLPPPCPSLDVAGDVRCEPCLATDSLLPCPVPTPIPIPIPCQWLDSVVECQPCDRVHELIRCVPDPCLATGAAISRICVPPDCAQADGLIKCEPVPPIDRLMDRPVERPMDARPMDQSVVRLTDREGNDVHLRTVDADS